MSAHTPGPWEASLVSNELGEVFVYSTPQRRVAQSLGAFGIGADEARANARLIAAAPDLLAALTLITEMDGDQPARSAWDMVRIARAAIAKASGAA